MHGVLRDQPGGRAGLVALLARQGNHIEADFAHHYRMDLRDLWRPGGGGSQLTWRRLKVLIDHLPPESDTKTALRDEMSPEDLATMTKELPSGKYGPWSRTDHLLAAVLDRLGALHAAVYRAQGAKVEYPDPWPRPGVKPDRVRRLTPEGAAYLQRLADEHAALHGSEEPAAEV